LIAVVAPVLATEAVDAGPAEIALEVQQLAEAPLCEHRLDLAQRRLEAPVVADGERQLALHTGSDGALGLLERQAERFLDEDVLASLCRGDDLLAVLRVGSGQYNGVDVACQKLFVAPEKRNAVPLAELFSPRGGARAA